jgi:hypothetical protein
MDDEDDDSIEFSCVPMTEEVARSLITLNSLPIISGSSEVMLPSMQSVLTHLDGVQHSRR